MSDLKQQKLLDSFKDVILEIFSEELLQIVLYNDKDPNSDDILIILKSFNLPKMKKANSAINKLIKNGFPAPLFMTQEFIKSSLDSYPLEFLNIKTDYYNLFVKNDEDFIKTLVFDNQFIRLQIERELKGKYLLITSNYIPNISSQKILNSLITRSILSLKPVLKGILYLNEKALPPIYEDLLESVQKTLNLEISSLIKAFNICYGKEKIKDINIDVFFDTYLKDIENLYKRLEN